jgi:hypothetical protein
VGRAEEVEEDEERGEEGVGKICLSLKKVDS